MIAALGGVLPDIDTLVFWILYFFGFTLEQVHRTYTHSLVFVAALLIIALLVQPLRSHQLGKHRIRLSAVFVLLAFGVFMHIALDSIIVGHNIKPFYPFSSYEIGFDLISFLPQVLQGLATPMLYGILLITWVVYLELKHKISDFI